MTSPTLSFDGTDDYVDCGDNSTFEPTNITISCWVNAGSQSSSYARLVDKSNQRGISEGGYRIFGSNTWSFQWYTGSDQIGVSGPSITQGEWVHITVTHDGSVGKIYENGTEVGSTTASFDPVGTYPFWIGASQQAGQYFTGEVDDVRVFDTALTQSEIQSVMDGHIIGSEVAHYPMNEGSGSTCSDATTNNNSGTINGATWSSRSSGTTYDWQTVTDWNNAQSEQNVVHNESMKLGIDGNEYIEIGQRPSHLTTTSEEVYYPISFIDSTTVYDVSGDNNSLTVSGTTKVEENNTRFPQSLSFDGTDDYVELPSAIQDTTSVVGTEFWFYPRSTGVQYLLQLYDFYDLQFDLLGNQQIRVGAYGDSTYLGPTNISLDTWHHCNFYWDIGTEYGISVDGGTWDTYTTTHTPSNQSDVSYLGVNGFDATAYFNGKLTELRFVADQRIDHVDSFYQDQGNLVTEQKS